MMTYHELDEMMLQVDQELEELYAEIEEYMLGNRVNIPMEVVDGNQSESRSDNNVPYPARG